MAEQNKFRFVSYARDMKVKTDKFRQFDQLIAIARDKGEFDAVVVASPQVLGDTYDELVANLNKLATAELAVVVVPPSDVAKSVASRN